MNETLTYQCPNCGAELFFDADKQAFSCEFCFSSFSKEEIDTSGAEERAKATAEENDDFCSHMNEYHCPSCGADVVADESTAADVCAYCHNPILLVGRLSGQKKPHKVIPFQYGKEEAEQKFLTFARKKWFVPRDFFSKGTAEKIQGIYYPFWVTDADTDSTLDGIGERRRVYRIGDTEYTEISKFAVHRGGDIHFEDIVSSALSEADKTMLEGVLPYPSSALVEFSMPYLSGYVAKKRDIERETLAPEVRKRMEGYAETLLRGTAVGYHTFMVTKKQVEVKHSHWDYSLLPIWMLTYHKNGKHYTFAMNGHTGKIYGELPISYARLAILFGSLTVSLTALFSLIGGWLL